MSWYYTYYLGYIKKDDKEEKIYPLGPFDYKGKLKDVFSKSRSFASDLHEDFRDINADQLDESFLKALGIEKNYSCIKMLSLSDLPKTDYVKSGYFLLSDVEEYYKYKNECSIGDLGIFYDKLTPEVYGLRLSNEIAFKTKKRIKYDAEGEEIEIHPCSDYTFFSYPDYNSKEYESFLIKNVANILYDKYLDDENIEVVVVETEG